MGDIYIDQTQNITKTTKKVETEIRNSVKNINVDLSKLDLSEAIDSFKRLEEASKAADFSGFISKIVLLQEVFENFQKSVRTANTSVTNFAKSSDKLAGGNTAIVTNVEVGMPDIGSDVGDMTSKIASSSASIGKGFASMGAGALDFGNGVAAAAGGISGLIDSVTELFTGFQTLGDGIAAAAGGVSALIPLLPQLGVSVLHMAVNTSGILQYLPGLIALTGILLALSLLGEGLAAAGTGLSGIGLGLTSMTMGMTALLEFMPLFIESLAGITANIGGIVLFVLLAAAMLAMALAMQMINEQLTQFTGSMEKLHGLMSVGFVAAFTVFGAMLIAMSFFMEKVAAGMDKVTQAMEKQAAKLAVLNPLLAAQAILTNPITGAVTVAAAVAGGLLVKALLPAMATGGVVTGPTIAMVGEGKYPEAVVPLGDSPQFAEMKADIANAVVQAVSALNVGSGKSARNMTVQLHIDGRQFAETTVKDFVDTLNNEGYSVLRADAVYR